MNENGLELQGICVDSGERGNFHLLTDAMSVSVDEAVARRSERGVLLVH
jgi:hypothetical protein